MTDKTIIMHPNYDTAFLRESFKSFIKQTDEFKNYDFDGSGLKEIIRILSYSDQNAAIQNQFMFNELNLDSADIYNNVLSLATKQGYLPDSKRAATITKTISVKADKVNSPEEIILTKENRFITRTTSNKILVFSPSKEYKAILDSNGYYTFTDVILVQGVWVNQSYTVQTGNSIESYKLSNYNIDTSTLTVAVKDSSTSFNYTVFSKFENGHDLGKGKNIYYLTCKKDGYYYVEFGDNIFSKKLEYQNIIYLNYLVTDGSDGNNVLNLTPSTPIAGFTDILIDGSEYSVNGSERESKESIKINASRNVSTKGNCVSDTDYESLVRKLYPNVSSVRAWGGEKSNPLKYGYTYISIKFKDFDDMSESLKTEIYNKISEKNVGSITPIIIDPDYTYMDLDLKLRINKDLTILTKDYIEIKVIDSLKKYSSEQLEFFDSNYETTNIIEFVKNVDKSIIGCSVINTMHKYVDVLINYAGVYEVDFKYSLLPGSIYIDGFSITDINNTVSTYFIKDDGNSKLQLFRKEISDSSEILIYQNLGTVDYNTGKISLTNFNPNYLDNSISVKVSARPKENSVFIESIYDTIFKIKDITIETTEINTSAI